MTTKLRLAISKIMELKELKAVLIKNTTRQAINCINFLCFFMFVTGCASSPALHLAVDQGDIEQISKIIEGHKNIDERGTDGNTALHLALINERNDIAELLLDSGADINAKNIDGWSPFTISIMKGNNTAAKMLIDRGADINMEYVELTPLMMAIMTKNSFMAKYLIVNGVNIKTATSYGETPLYYAVHYELENIAHMLIDRGADINARTIDSRTPLHAAAFNGNRALLDYLLDRGAQISAADDSEMGIYSTAFLYRDSAQYYEKDGNIEKSVEYFNKSAAYFKKSADIFESRSTYFANEKIKIELLNTLQVALTMAQAGYTARVNTAITPSGKVVGMGVATNLLGSTSSLSHMKDIYSKEAKKSLMHAEKCYEKISCYNRNQNKEGLEKCSQIKLEI